MVEGERKRAVQGIVMLRKEGGRKEESGAIESDVVAPTCGSDRKAR